MPAATPAFHADDSPQIAEYRTMSVLAIVSLLFGLAAPLCFAAPLLMVLPLVGTVFSIVALVSIERSDGALAGRGAATVGLALCVASATAAITHAQATKYLRTAQAEKFGREWIGLLLSGQTEPAFLLSFEGARPAPPLEPGQPAPEKSPREYFDEDPLTKALAAAGADAEVRDVDTLSYEPRSSHQDVVRQRFTIAPRAADGNVPSKSMPIEVILTLQQTPMQGELRSPWLVARHELSPSSDAGQVSP